MWETEVDSGTQLGADLLCWLRFKVIRLPDQSELWLLPHLLEVVGSQGQCLGVDTPEPQAMGFRCHLCYGLFLIGCRELCTRCPAAWLETWATLARFSRFCQVTFGQSRT